ncbi:TRAP transporter substrate-binding protein [Sulfurospirillum sp. 1612]|uniref:TRAP transporter substrate-binding protein n=1 Tax=Sulfurospirillum sp. 1612 TaxID=3094835 RepID=UPI002F9495E6
MKFKNILLALGLVLAVASTSYASKTIRVTLQLPISHPLGENWLEFKKLVEKNSNGDLKVLIFPSAQLYKDKQVPEAVGSGAIEAGTAFLGRFTGSVPAVDVVGLPFFFKDSKSLRKAVKSGSHMRTILDKAILKETGAKILWWQAYGHNVYLNNGKPIRVPDDLKGKKVRTYGKILSWTAEAAGGYPTIMSGSKQFLAYQQHAVDVGMTGLSAVGSRKLYEVMKNMTVSNDSIIEFVAIMNDKFFESLTPKEKKIILDAAAIVEKHLRDKIYSSEDKMVEDLKSKMNVIELTPAERKAWQKIAKPVMQRFIKATGSMGEEVIKAAREDEAQ